MSEGMGESSGSKDSSRSIWGPDNERGASLATFFLLNEEENHQDDDDHEDDDHETLLNDSFKPDLAMEGPGRVTFDGHEAKVMIYREHMTRLNGTNNGPRFVTVSSLLKFLGAGSTLKAIDPGNVDLFVDLSTLQQDVPQCQQGRSSQAVENCFQFLEMVNLENVLKPQIIEYNGRLFYPIVEDRTLKKVLEHFSKFQEERIGRKLKAAMVQIGRYFSGQGQVNRAMSFLQASSQNVFGDAMAGTADENRVRHCRGLHEFWELTLHRPNHEEISDELLKFVVSVIVHADRNSDAQALACGALQALVGTDRSMRDRLLKFEIVQCALECLRIHIGNILAKPPPPAALHLFKLLMSFRTHEDSLSMILSEIGFFTTCLQSGASDEFVAGLVSIFLPSLAHKRYSDFTCALTQNGTAFRRNMFRGRTATITIGHSMQTPTSLGDFLKELANHSVNYCSDIGIKLGTTLMLANLACAAENQVYECILDAESRKCPSDGKVFPKSTLPKTSPDVIPMLHPLRELLLSMRCVPTQVCDTLRWALASVSKLSLSGTPVGHCGRQKMNILMAENTTQTSRANKKQSQKKNVIKGAGTVLGSLSEDIGTEGLTLDDLEAEMEEEEEEEVFNGGFLVLPPGLQDSIGSTVMYAAGWEYIPKTEDNDEKIDAESQRKLPTCDNLPNILLETIHHAAMVIFEWCVALEQQSRLNEHSYMRYRNSSAIPNSGTHISERELESVFAGLSHILGFVHDGWLREHINVQKVDTWKYDRLEELELLCLRGIERLFRVPQCADRILTKFGFPNFGEFANGKKSKKTASLRNSTRLSVSLASPLRRRRSSVASCKAPRQAIMKNGSKDDMYVDVYGKKSALRKPQRIKTTEDCLVLEEVWHKNLENLFQEKMFWPNAPILTCLNTQKCQSPEAEELVAQNIIHILSSGTIGYSMIAIGFGVDGLLKMLHYNSWTHEKSIHCKNLLAAAIMLISYGAVGLQADQPWVDKTLANFGKRMEDPSKLGTINQNGVKIELAKPPRKIPKEHLQQLVGLLDAHACNRRYFSFCSYIAMSLWCIARNKTNALTLCKSTQVVRALISIIDNGIYACQSILTDLDFMEEHEMESVNLKSVQGNLDLLESVASVLWLLASQKKSQTWFVKDVRMYRGLYHVIALIEKLALVIQRVPHLHIKSVEDCQPQRIVLLLLNFCWTFIDSDDFVFLGLLHKTNGWMIRTFHTLSQGKSLNSSVRARSSHLLAYLVRRIETSMQRAKEKEDKTAAKELRSKLQETVGENGLLQMSLEMLKREENPKLRSVAALLLATTKLQLEQHQIIRASAVLPVLIDIATEATDHERRCALLALINCAQSGLNQEQITKYGLYRLLLCSWLLADAKMEDLQHLTATLLTKISQNAKNRTRIYQAEMRAKAIKGFYSFKEIIDIASESQDGTGNQTSDRDDNSINNNNSRRRESMLDKQHSTGNFQPDEANDPHHVNHVNVSDKVRDRFLEWIEELEKDNNTKLLDAEEGNANIITIGEPGTDPIPISQLRDDSSNSKLEEEYDDAILEHRDLRKAVKIVQSMSNAKDRFVPPERVKAPHQSPLWPYRSKILPVARDEEEKDDDVSAATKTVFGDLKIAIPNQAALQASFAGKSRLQRKASAMYIFDCISSDDDDSEVEEEKLLHEKMMRAKKVDANEMLRRAKEQAKAITTKSNQQPVRPLTEPDHGRPLSPRKKLVKVDAIRKQNETKWKRKPSKASNASPKKSSKERQQQSLLSSRSTKGTNSEFGQQMRAPAKSLWEAYRSNQSPWHPTITRVTKDTVTVENDSFMFAVTQQQQDEKLLKEVPSVFLDKYSKKTKERKQLNGYAPKKTLALFSHVQGSRILSDLPNFDAPLGNNTYAYYKGDVDSVTAFFDDKELGLPNKPVTLFDLGRLTMDTNALDPEEQFIRREEWKSFIHDINVSKDPTSASLSNIERKSLATLLSPFMVQSALPKLPNLKIDRVKIMKSIEPRLRERFGEPELPKSYSQNPGPRSPNGDDVHFLEKYEMGQYETSVIWTEKGRIVDDSLHFLLRVPGRLKDLIRRHFARSSQGRRGGTGNIDTSAFGGRRRFLDDNPIAKSCVAYDWDLACKKGNFRDFLGKYDPEDVKQVREMIINAASILCAAYRFYCALTPQNPFAMLQKTYVRFITDVQILQNAERRFRESCINLFIKVARSVPDVITPQMKLVNEKCDPLGIQKGRKLMRHDFFEILVRVAELTYIDNLKTCANLTDAVSSFMRLNIIRYLGPETVLDFDSWRVRRLYNTPVSTLFLQHKQMLETWFTELAGKSMRSPKWGGIEKKRMTIHEWTQGLRNLGLFSPNFTQREATYAFALSTTHVVDWIKEWHPVVSLTYPDFLEAIGRVTELVVIPTPKVLEFFGVDDIVEFYTLMERTNLWSAVDQDSTDAESRLTLWMENGGVSDTEKDIRPLSEKLKEFLKLLAARHGIENKRKVESSFWHGGSSAQRQPRNSMLSSQKRSSAPKRGFSFNQRNVIRQDLVQHRREEERERRSSMASQLGKVMDDESKYEDEDEMMEDEEEEEDRFDEDYENKINGVSNQLETFEISTATYLHEMWRSKRERLPDGRFEPRIKLINGVEYDIANLVFKDLPDYFKLENLLASHVACDSIRRLWLDMEVIPEEDIRNEKFREALQTTEFLEHASEDQHIAWLKRNRKHAWVSDEQKLPYAQLSEGEKQKDRDIVLAAIDVYLKNNFTTV